MADTKKNTAKVELHLLEPRATEKTYAESMKRTYVFPVKKSMSKQEIAKLVEKEFNVTVISIRTLIRDGKKTKYSKGKHAYPGTTFRQDKKFAYVTLKEGDSIKVFEEQEDNTKASAKDVKEAKKAEKEAKKTKKADKNAGKENK
ncbi:50S ribosomal protein L23 [Candidatus Saccharibacteria bacterium]|nr:50S ribosomal protein L23 [Candidatus Saccharibacteria bacterium]